MEQRPRQKHELRRTQHRCLCSQTPSPSAPWRKWIFASVAFLSDVTHVQRAWTGHLRRLQAQMRKTGVKEAGRPRSHFTKNREGIPMSLTQNTFLWARVTRRWLEVWWVFLVFKWHLRQAICPCPSECVFVLGELHTQIWAIQISLGMESPTTHSYPVVVSVRSEIQIYQAPSPGTREVKS